MAIIYEHSVDLPTTPDAVFVFLDDFLKVPLWLTRCEGVAKCGQGPNKLGDKLRYAYHEGGKHRIMDGVITGHDEGQLLSYRCFDKMMQVMVEFRIAPTDAGAHLTHRVEIIPQSLLAKILSPMFKYKLPKQTTEALENVRRILTEEATATRH